VSEKNKALVRDFIAACDNHDMVTERRLMSDDFRWNRPEPEKPVTADECIALLVTHHRAFPDWRHVVHDLVAEGDRVVARMDALGTHRGDMGAIAATLKQVRVAQIAVYRVREGKVAEMWAVEDILGLMQQLGMELKPKDR
jgi:steroid delta-isomerase-like uncharacterized protein